MNATDTPTVGTALGGTVAEAPASDVIEVLAYPEKPKEWKPGYWAKCQNHGTEFGDKAGCSGWKRSDLPQCAKCLTAQKSEALGNSADGRIPMPVTGGPWSPCPTCTTGWRTVDFLTCKRCHDRGAQDVSQNYRGNGKSPIPAEKLIEYARKQIERFKGWLDETDMADAEVLAQAEEFLVDAEEAACFDDEDSYAEVEDLAHDAVKLVGGVICEALVDRWNSLYDESHRYEGFVVPQDARDLLAKYGALYAEEEFGLAAGALLSGTGILNAALKPVRQSARQNGNGKGEWHPREGKTERSGGTVAAEKRRAEKVARDVLIREKMRGASSGKGQQYGGGQSRDAQRRARRNDRANA